MHVRAALRNGLSRRTRTARCPNPLCRRAARSQYRHAERQIIANVERCEQRRVAVRQGSQDDRVDTLHGRQESATVRRPGTDPDGQDQRQARCATATANSAQAASGAPKDNPCSAVGDHDRAVSCTRTVRNSTARGASARLGDC